MSFLAACSLAAAEPDWAQPAAVEWESSNHFALQHTEGLKPFDESKKDCRWSKPTSLLNHTLRYMRARYPFAKDARSLEQRADKFFAGCGPTWRVQAQVCELPATVDPASGATEQWFITRVGPLPLPFNAYTCIALIPAMPTQRTTFLVESIDRYLGDHRDGRGYREVDYPPVHPHHANTFLVGYDASLTQFGDGIFSNFYPWAAYTTHQLVFRGAQASMNTPGFNADFVGCQPGLSNSECFYLKLPKGTGFPIYKGTDMWSTSLINRMGQWREPPGQTMQILWEFGRKFVTLPAARQQTQQQITPVWTVDFSVTGDGNTYPLRAKRNGQMMYHTFHMPVGGRVVGSWFHTHAQAPSDLWVMDRPHSELMPPKIHTACYERQLCRPSRGRSSGTTVLGQTGALMLDELGWSVESLQEYLLAHHKGSLRCAYKSMAQDVDGVPWGRQSLRSKASRSTCDGWTFKPGQPVTLIAFNHRFEHTEVVQQHQRWWPVCELFIPRPAAFAGFRMDTRSGEYNATVPAEAIARSDLFNDWMEYMG